MFSWLVQKVTEPPYIQIAKDKSFFLADPVKEKCLEIFPNATLFLGRMRDTLYNLPTYTGIWTLVKAYRKKHNYVLDFYDCDDIAIDFWAWCHHPNVSGIPAAYCESQPHAFNFIVGWVEKGEMMGALQGLTVFIVEAGGETPFVWPLFKSLSDYNSLYRVTGYVI